ncbi:hypothetical protein PVK06_024669 [Gossypium arboreum]|uniref:Uncharacterized protein n=1 Tax=Gossypium arboreum TaxID=29729 RepID=A0ABR0PEB3_GOSAR|nr:hypothetical protein PVK06_024669 [Gossypium arboreum]
MNIVIPLKSLQYSILLEGECRVSDTSDDILLSLNLFEAEFHCPFNSLFCSIHDEYGIVARLAHFSARQGYDPIIKNWAYNLHLSSNKFIWLDDPSPNGYKPSENTFEVISWVANPSDAVQAYKASDDLASILVLLNRLFLRLQNSMDVDIFMKRVLKSNDDTDVRVQVGDSSRKRLRTNGGSHSTKDCSGGKLIHRKRGKRPITFERESNPPVPSTLYETQDEFAITPMNVSPLA